MFLESLYTQKVLIKENDEQEKSNGFDPTAFNAFKSYSFKKKYEEPLLELFGKFQHGNISYHDMVSEVIENVRDKNPKIEEIEGILEAALEASTKVGGFNNKRFRNLLQYGFGRWIHRKQEEEGLVKESSDEVAALKEYIDFKKAKDAIKKFVDTLSDIECGQGDLTKKHDQQIKEASLLLQHIIGNLNLSKEQILKLAEYYGNLSENELGFYDDGGAHDNTIEEISDFFDFIYRNKTVEENFDPEFQAFKDFSKNYKYKSELRAIFNDIIDYVNSENESKLKKIKKRVTAFIREIESAKLPNEDFNDIGDFLRNKIGDYNDPIHNIYYQHGYGGYETDNVHNSFVRLLRCLRRFNITINNHEL